MAVIALCLWVVVAWCLMMLLTGRQTWIAACGLAVTGIPIVGWLAGAMGWVWAFAGAAVVGLVLRWPLLRIGQRLRSLVSRGAP